MHRRSTFIVLLALLLAVPAVGQKQTPQQALAQGQIQQLNEAQQALTTAEQAGAATYAKSLYDDAAWRLRYAQENWSAAKDSTREQARLRANEALWAARAALAKARWVGTNEAIRSLQSDITRLGGRSDLTLQEEPSAVAIDRGADSKARIDYAQAIIDQAKAAGGERVEGNDLKSAQDNLESARKIIRNQKQSESADHLAYVAEMIARRAYYLARLNDSVKYLPDLQMNRTRLAQAESERQAAAERAQREQAQRQATDLQQQLAAEQANRQAQAAEVERLRQQVEESRRAAEEQLARDRAARADAERQLDELRAKYETAITSGNTTQVEALRRQVEDQQIALRSIQDRENLNEQQMQAQIERLRADVAAAQQQGNVSAQQLNERQAMLIQREQELEALRKERQDDQARRADLDRQHQQAIDEATRRRQEAEAQAQALRTQVEQAQQAAQQATAAAQQTASELERSRQQASSTQAELERTRQELAQRDVELRRERMEAELSKLASTRTDQGRFIVTLSGGILFDTGKSALKPGAKSTLKKIAAQLKAEDTIHIAVEGHTDSVGTEASNQTLSDKRAQAVRDYLVSEGVPDGRITSAGKGEAEPIATNKTAAGRQQNRRVELVITHS